MNAQRSMVAAMCGSCLVALGWCHRQGSVRDDGSPIEEVKAGEIGSQLGRSLVPSPTAPTMSAPSDRKGDIASASTRPALLGSAGARASAPSPVLADGAPTRGLPRDANLDQVAARWEGQRSDPEWSSFIHEYMRSTFSDLQTKGRATDVACRETLCRLVLEFESPSEANRFSEEVANQELKQWIRIRNGESAFEVEVFFERDGLD